MITDAASNTREVNIVISQIDRAAPVIDPIGYPTTPTNQPIPLSITANDGASSGGIAAGLATAAYSFDDGSTRQTGNTQTFTSNQTVNVKVRDAAGNIASTGVIISTIYAGVTTGSRYPDCNLNDFQVGDYIIAACNVGAT
jgi:hypothetical protein